MFFYVFGLFTLILLFLTILICFDQYLKWFDTFLVYLCKYFVSIFRFLHFDITQCGTFRFVYTDILIVQILFSVFESIFQMFSFFSVCFQCFSLFGLFPWLKIQSIYISIHVWRLKNVLTNLTIFLLLTNLIITNLKNEEKSNRAVKVYFSYYHKKILRS